MKTIRLPNGRAVTLGSYVRFWQQVRRLPDAARVDGFSWIHDTAGECLAEIRRGVHDRINRHLVGRTFGRDSIADLQADRRVIEDALHRRTFSSGTNLLRTRYLRKRYPQLNNRMPCREP